MGTMIIGGAIVTLAEVRFNCPSCNKGYNDKNDKYFDRMRKTKYGHITIKCDCGDRFGLCQDIKCNLVSYELTRAKRAS